LGQYLHACLESSRSGLILAEREVRLRHEQLDATVFRVTDEGVSPMTQG